MESPLAIRKITHATARTLSITGRLLIPYDSSRRVQSLTNINSPNEVNPTPRIAYNTVVIVAGV